MRLLCFFGIHTWKRFEEETANWYKQRKCGRCGKYQWWSGHLEAWLTNAKD